MRNCNGSIIALLMSVLLLSGCELLEQWQENKRREARASGALLGDIEASAYTSHRNKQRALAAAERCKDKAVELVQADIERRMAASLTAGARRGSTAVAAVELERLKLGLRAARRAAVLACGSETRDLVCVQAEEVRKAFYIQRALDTQGADMKGPEKAINASADIACKTPAGLLASGE